MFINIGKKLILTTPHNPMYNSSLAAIILQASLRSKIRLIGWELGNLIKMRNKVTSKE